MPVGFPAALLDEFDGPRVDNVRPIPDQFSLVKFITVANFANNYISPRAAIIMKEQGHRPASSTSFTARGRCKRLDRFCAD